MSEVSYIGAEGFSGNPKEKINFRIVILKHLERIGLNANTEWHGGYWNIRERPVGNGLSINEKYYVQDSREVYINSIDYLYDLCYPYFSKDTLKRFEDLFDKYEKGKDKAAKEKKSKELKLQHSRKVFRELSVFLKSVQYFKSTSFEDEDSGVDDED